MIKVSFVLRRLSQEFFHGKNPTTQKYTTKNGLLNVNTNKTDRWISQDWQPLLPTQFVPFVTQDMLARSRRGCLLVDRTEAFHVLLDVVLSFPFDVLIHFQIFQMSTILQFLVQYCMGNLKKRER